MKTKTKTPLSFIDGLKTINYESTQKLIDIIYSDGSKLYETINYGQILIEDNELVKLIDDYCETLNPQLFDQLENEDDETKTKVFRIIN